MQRKFVVIALVVLAVGLLAPPVFSQLTTSGIRGKVVDATGGLPNAQVVAVNTQSGFTYQATADAEGNFVLSGLVPGTYDVKVSSEAYTEQSVRVQVQVGRDALVNATLSPTEVFMGDVTVVGETTKLLVDARAPEIATNVTEEQMVYLPQSSRNFLEFAALAPGIRTADDENAQQVFSSGGQNSRQSNVYIDGMSYKNDVLTGGAFMQDASKGNPFPQNAVQEYKVITQNFKAEYEKASSAVITAITKSGGNAFHGDAFYLLQDKGMVTLDPISEERGFEKPDYERQQWGLSVGGPIIKDKFHFFASYERNAQDRYSTVYQGSQYGSAPADVKQKLDAYEIGNILSPFKSDLYFLKGTYQPGVSQNLELSYAGRDEDEQRGFGGTRVYEGAEDFQISSAALTLRHTMVGSENWFNEGVLGYQQQRWFPTSLYPDKVRENYFGLLDVGGKDSTQDFTQDRYALRDDFTYLLGKHTLKGGINYNHMQYDIVKELWYNPTFDYRDTEQWAYPFEVIYGFGDPAQKYSNDQFGIYVQDDWRVNNELTVNFGLRWDYESNMTHNDWVTPEAIFDGLYAAERTTDGTTVKLSDVLDIEQFTTDGSDRPEYMGMIQPRLGFAWDIKGAGKTVIVGSIGRYYDRVQQNDIFDEAYGWQWLRYRICFSADGGPRGDCPLGTIQWDPKYYDKAELDKLIASGNVEGPEVKLLDNDLEPPKTDQWSLGIRHQLSSNWLGSITYAGMRGDNGLSYFFANLLPTATFNSRWGDRIPVPITYPNGKTYQIYSLYKGMSYRESWYNAIYLTLDKPYTGDSKWGFNLAYTYQKAKQTGASFAGDGGVAFELDHLYPEDLEEVPSNFDERHRIVVSGTAGLPFNFRVSGILTLGSGYPYTIANAYNGWSNFYYEWNAARPKQFSFLGWENWAYRSFDLRLDWTAMFGGGLGLTLILEGFNLFDWENYSYDTWGGSGFLPPQGETNPNFGEPTGAYSPRRYQAGLRFTF